MMLFLLISMLPTISADFDLQAALDKQTATLPPTQAPAAKACHTHVGCAACSKHRQCAFCIDDLSAGHCTASGCHSLAHGRTAWVPRSCHSKQMDCMGVFKKLFPGSTMQDAGPCQAVMASNFKPGTCVGEAKRCSVLVADMLDVCVGQVWPDIPKGNQPHVGLMFTDQRAKAMKVAFERAGCDIPKKIHAKPTYHPTFAPVPATPGPTFKPDPEETAHQTARENQFEQSLQSAGYNQWQAPAPAPANQ